MIPKKKKQKTTNFPKIYIKKCLTGFNGEALPGGVPEPERGRLRKSAHQAVLEVCLYTQAARDGWASGRGFE